MFLKFTMENLNQLTTRRESNDHSALPEGNILVPKPGGHEATSMINLPGLTDGSSAASTPFRLSEASPPGKGRSGSGVQVTGQERPHQSEAEADTTFGTADLSSNLMAAASFVANFGAAGRPLSSTDPSIAMMRSMFVLTQGSSMCCLLTVCQGYGYGQSTPHRGTQARIQSAQTSC